MVEREYQQPLDQQNRMRVRFAVDTGMVTWFVVQFESQIEGRWVPIVRYDTAHGFAHRDIMHPRGEPVKEPLDFSNFNDALTFAVADIQVQWQRYLRRYAKWQSES